MDEKTSQSVTLETPKCQFGTLNCTLEELARQQAQLAQEQQELHRRKGLLDNGDPNFKNGKEKIYDRLPVTAKQMDLVVKVLEAAIVVVLAVALLDKYLF